MNNKQYCVRGHDTFKTGRTLSYNCKACTPILWKDKKYGDKFKEKHKEYSLKRARKEYSVLNGTKRSHNGMLTRCYCKSHSGYTNYGARGITVTPRWRGEGGYARFLEDMGPRPTKKHTIDRIDPSGNYEPSNCRWITMKGQAINKRSSNGK